MELTQDRYLPPKEVAEFTGRPEQTLANERFKGVGIPYVKIGRSVRYRLSDVIAFMEKHRVDPGERREGS